MGNNGNDRRDFVLYYLNEPSPTAARTSLLKKVFLQYPQQSTFPAAKDDFNYDCESIFTIGDEVYFLTKHRSDTMTRLYRLDSSKPDVVNPLALAGDFDVRGQAVGADATPDDLKLVIITYDKIWLFQRTSKNLPFFEESIRVSDYSSKQVEAVCFAGDNTLLMADEELGQLFSVNISDLLPFESPK